MSLNRVELIGNLGVEPEVLKETKKGKFVRLSIGTNKKYKNAKEEIIKDTQWHTIYLNNWLADRALLHLKKGSKVYVCGELRTSTWEDEKTGENRFSVGIHAKSLEVIAMLPRDEDDSSSDNDAVEDDPEYRAAVEEARKKALKKRQYTR